MRKTHPRAAAQTRKIPQLKIDDPCGEAEPSSFVLSEGRFLKACSPHRFKRLSKSAGGRKVRLIFDDGCSLDLPNAREIEQFIAQLQLARAERLAHAVPDHFVALFFGAPDSEGEAASFELTVSEIDRLVESLKRYAARSPI